MSSSKSMTNLESVTDEQLMEKSGLSVDDLAELKASDAPRNSDGTWNMAALLKYKFRQAFPEES